MARQDGNEELKRSFDKDVLPIIGDMPLSTLAERDILAVLRGIRARGLNRSVVGRSNDIGQMLRWAEKRQPWRGLMVDGKVSILHVLLGYDSGCCMTIHGWIR